MKKSIYAMLFKFAVLPFVLIIIVDYFNIPSIVGFKMSYINPDLFSALINALVVIGLYIITYVVIDKRQLRKDDNAKLTANVLMLSSYQKCVDILKIVDNQEWLENHIVPKIDFNRVDSENKVSMNLQNNPFTEHSHILDFAGNGSIISSDLSAYLNIMELYKSYVSMRITFFDIYNAQTVEQMQVREKITQDKNKLYSLLDREILKLQKELKEV